MAQENRWGAPRTHGELKKLGFDASEATVSRLIPRTDYGIIILSHERRRIIHFGVARNPTAEWVANQVTGALPYDTAPRFMLRDRDSVFDEQLKRRVRSMGIEDVVTAPSSPWQNSYVERLLGSIRRECLDHVIVLGQRHRHGLLRDYFRYYHEDRCYLGLDKDAPDGLDWVVWGLLWPAMPFLWLLVLPFALIAGGVGWLLCRLTDRVLSEDTD